MDRLPLGKRVSNINIVMKPVAVPSISVKEAWLSLSNEEWSYNAARHLLRRAGWTAHPKEVEKIYQLGLKEALNYLFPLEPVSYKKPDSLVKFVEEESNLENKIRDLTGLDKVKARRELQNKQRGIINDLTVAWLKYASYSSYSAYAKWVLFLSDVYVIGADKVRNPLSIYNYFNTLAYFGNKNASSLTKAVSRTPAMIQYLDLNNSTKKAPNENFARELFELFVLGEGNYSEKDIKESARAFTGYKSKQLKFNYSPQTHDGGIKNIFDSAGSYTGDDVIDIAYRQPAAHRFLPQEMVRFYLCENNLPEEYIEEIGRQWRKNNFNLRTLQHTFFGSKLFFSEQFRNNFIKSPIQYYLGTVQDLNLNVSPLARHSVDPLRQMGQLLYFPPNVRGWVGGRNWINSTTLAARHQFVNGLFSKIDARSFNADEQAALKKAEKEVFVVNEAVFLTLAKNSTKEIINVLTSNFISGDSTLLAKTLETFIDNGPPGDPQRARRIQRAVVALMQSPEYQIC